MMLMVLALYMVLLAALVPFDGGDGPPCTIRWAYEDLSWSKPEDGSYEGLVGERLTGGGGGCSPKNDASLLCGFLIRRNVSLSRAGFEASAWHNARSSASVSGLSEGGTDVSRNFYHKEIQRTGGIA